MATLKIQIPDQAPQSLELTGDVVVGRVAPADIVLADAKVSRRHCRFTRTPAGWSVEDLGSSNGTRVAGRVIKTHPLRHGDKVEVGRSVLVFEVAPRKTFAAPSRGSSVRDRLAKKRRR